MNDAELIAQFRTPIADTTSPPDALVHEQSVRDLLNRALQNLPEEQRVVIIMKEYQGLKFTEIAAILIFTFLNIEFAIRDGAFHATIGLRSSTPPERVAIADTSEVSSLDTPITLGEFIAHQQNLIDYTNRLVQTSQNQQRDEVNNTFIRLVSELQTQRQQDLLRIDRGLHILYNTYETRYGHILAEMDSVKNIFYDSAVEVYEVPVDNRPYRKRPASETR